MQNQPSKSFIYYVYTLREIMDQNNLFTYRREFTLVSRQMTYTDDTIHRMKSSLTLRSVGLDDLLNHRDYH